MGKYNLKQISKEIREIALNTAYHGNSLYVALDLPFLDIDDKFVIKSYLNGRHANNPISHLQLQAVAIKINERASLES